MYTVQYLMTQRFVSHMKDYHQIKPLELFNSSADDDDDADDNNNNNNNNNNNMSLEAVL